MRRLLSLALSIVMVLSLLPAGALAEEPVLDEPVQEELVQEELVQEELVQEPKTETCTHGNDPAVCEACASEARVAAVQAQIDALPRDVTAETKEAAQSALSAVDTAKSALTESEQAQLDMTRYTALTQKLAALESPAPSATGDTTEKTAKVISAWAWIDEEEYLDEETGGLALPGASEEMPAYFVDVVTFLPYEITATVDGVEETLTIDWVCDNYPEDGAYEGEYTFTATLPEGYALDEGVKALTVPVLLGGIKRYATEISYMTWSDSLKKLVPAECSNATEVTGSESDTAITWGESGKTTWYVVNSDLTIGTSGASKDDNSDAVIQVLGDVHLILADGCSLTVYGRIEVNDDKYNLTAGSGTLTIYGQSAGTGKLTVNSPTWERDSCAIGGKFANKLVDDVNDIYNYNDGGAITINGGIIKATFRGKYNGAAIGGPAGGTSTVTINGGVVTADNKGEGAGIGGGSGAATITINGGTITASASNGAGIGNKATSGETNITINGGTVTASSSKGAGIGSGESSKGSVAVTINGGKVTAKSTTGAAIGNGKAGTGIATVIINGGTIDASTTNKLGNVTEYGAAIGCGVDSGKTSVTINNCTKVTARGGESAPGIGSTKSTGGIVTIKGGTVEAYGGHQAAGIGGANHCNSCTVVIEGGNVKAQGGGLAAGIGTGDGNGQTQGAITISGGTVSAIGGKWAAGIGGGNGNVAGTINISGGTVIVTRDGTDSGAVAHTAMDVGDGANSDANKDVYTRFTLSGSAKLYLQHDYLVTEHTNITSGYIFKQFETKPEDYSVVQVFGEQTLSENFCIDTGKTMTVMSGASLSTGSNKLYVKGTLTETGTVSGNIYYPLTLVNCTADSSYTSTYGDSNDLFGKAGSTITLTPTLAGGYRFDRWAVNPDTVTVSSSSNSFPMPQKATTVEAKGTQVLQITQQPEPTTTIIYGDRAILSVTAQNSSGGTDGITYQWYKGIEKLPNETSKTLPLRYLNASTQPYSFYCEVSCNGASINSNTATVKVNKAQASVTIDSDPSKTYDGTPVATPSHNFSGSGFPKIEYKLQSKPDTAYKETAPKDAGSYTVRVTMSENQNYKGASATKDFTISKATDNAWRTAPSVAGFTYGDTVTNPVKYQALYGDDDVVVTYKKQGTQDTPSTTVPKDAGTYDVTVTLEETNNYGPKLEATNLTLTIAKADSSVTTAPTDAQSLYTGGNVPLVNAGTTGDGTMKYSLDGENWSKDIPTATDWKTYTVYYKVAGDNNHNDTEAKSLTAEIVPFEIQTQPQPVTIDYGNDAEMSVTLDTILSDITYQWYQLTDERDVELTDATESTLTLTKPIAGEYTYVCKITCGEYSATSAEAVVTVNAVSQPLPTTDLPDGLWAEGGEEPLNGDSIDLKSPSSRLLTKYTEGKNTQGDPYPAGMQIYSVEKDDQGQTVVVPVAELDNLLQYSGCSIRINGKPGIRMITSLTKEAKAALTKAGLAGYTLEEYGTVVAWSKELDGPLTLSTGSSNYAYRKGVSDPVFANVGNLTQYTNVLVWDSLPDEKYAMDIAMRPYIILSKDGETVTLYGGTVSRSIGYVAQQNADTFPKGSAGYKYVHDIIDRVNKLTNNSQQS